MYIDKCAVVVFEAFVSPDTSNFSPDSDSGSDTVKNLYTDKCAQVVFEAFVSPDTSNFSPDSDSGSDSI